MGRGFGTALFQRVSFSFSEANIRRTRQRPRDDALRRHVRVGGFASEYWREVLHCKVFHRADAKRPRRVFPRSVGTRGVWTGSTNVCPARAVSAVLLGTYLNNQGRHPGRLEGDWRGRNRANPVQQRHFRLKRLLGRSALLGIGFGGTIGRLSFRPAAWMALGMGSRDPRSGRTPAPGLGCEPGRTRLNRNDFGQGRQVDEFGRRRRTGQIEPF